MHQPPEFGTQQPNTAYPPPAPPTNALAIVSFISALAGWVTALGFIVAVICGHMATRQIKERGEGGESLAKAGLVIGYIGLGIMVLSVIVIVALSIMAMAASTV